MRKKVDSRIRTLVENGVKSKHRSLFVIVGDKGREQVGGGKQVEGFACALISLVERTQSYEATARRWKLLLSSELFVESRPSRCSFVHSFAGGQSSLHTFQGQCKGSPVCALVLQERSFLLQVPMPHCDSVVLVLVVLMSSDTAQATLCKLFFSNVLRRFFSSPNPLLNWYYSYRISSRFFALAFLHQPTYLPTLRARLPAFLPAFLPACLPACHPARALACMLDGSISHRKKRLRQLKKMMQRGLLDADKEDPFALFMASTAIRYCYYAETHRILGSTYGMCVLQVRKSNAVSGSL